MQRIFPAPQRRLAVSPAPEMAFNSSQETTLGVELELQIVEHDSRELVPGATRILDACAQEGLQGVDGEFLLSMLEIKTGVCTGVADAEAQLFSLLGNVSNIAGTLGCDLVSGGTHPFSRPSASAISPHPRYQQIRKRQGWLAYHEAIFGLHVHVGVPGAEQAVGLMNLLTPYLPHLLALSANSPFWQGVDTEFASARAVLFRPAAHAGVPPNFPNWESLCQYHQAMKQGGAVETLKDLYWDLRPRPDMGTLEFRIFDAPATPGCLLALVALTHCLVVAGLRALEADPDLGRGDPARHWLAAENKAAAARYGLQAVCCRGPGLPRQSLAEDLAVLIDELLPVARDLGEESFLREVMPIVGFETGAAHQRRLYRQTGSWPAVIDDTRSRWAVAGGHVPRRGGTALSEPWYLHSAANAGTPAAADRDAVLGAH